MFISGKTHALSAHEKPCKTPRRIIPCTGIAKKGSDPVKPDATGFVCQKKSSKVNTHKTRPRTGFTEVYLYRNTA